MDFNLKIWQLHPNCAKILPAEKTLHNTANPSGVKWCGPYTSANKSGWWLFPPIDIDILWKGGKDFEYKMISEYTDDDYHLVRSLMKPSDKENPDKWCPQGGRTKFTWGMVDPGVVQFWTGLIFETPPGWCLHLRSPINFPPQNFYIQEGIEQELFLSIDSKLFFYVVFILNIILLKVYYPNYIP